MGALLGVVATAAVGCSKKQDNSKAEAEKVQASQKDGDRYNDGKRLAKQLKSWPKQWREMSDLPSCELLLKDASDLELCKAAGNAQAVMKAAVAKPEPDPVLIHDAAELMFANVVAWEKLRAALDALEASPPAAAPSASAPPGKVLPKAPVPASSALSKAKPGSSAAVAVAGKAVDPEVHEQARHLEHTYLRVDQLTRRYLIFYLQFAPLPTRKLTFAELEAVSKRKQPWYQLGHTLLEAAHGEDDRALRGKLKALGHSLRNEAAGAKE